MSLIWVPMVFPRTPFPGGWLSPPSNPLSGDCIPKPLPLSSIRRTRFTSRSSLRAEVEHRHSMVPALAGVGHQGNGHRRSTDLTSDGLEGGGQSFLVEDAQGFAPNPTGDALGCVPSTPHPSASLPMHAEVVHRGHLVVLRSPQRAAQIAEFWKSRLASSPDSLVAIY